MALLRLLGRGGAAGRDGLARAAVCSRWASSSSTPLSKSARPSYIDPPFLGSSRDDVLGDPVRAVLLENIHPLAENLLTEAGFEVVTYDRALTGEELVDVATDCHVLGIRSKTQLDADFFQKVGYRPHRLWTVGCFCIGTNQVNLDAANLRGVSVFNGTSLHVSPPPSPAHPLGPTHPRVA